MRTVSTPARALAGLALAVTACAGAPDDVIVAPQEASDASQVDDDRAPDIVGDASDDTRRADVDGPAETAEEAEEHVAADGTADVAAPGPHPALDEAGSGDLDLEIAADGRELRLRTGTGTEVLAVLHPEGESTFVAAVPRPGSTRSDASIVALTMAEGFYDLRYLTYRDGQASDLTVFPEPHRPEVTMLADGGVAPLPVWSPDGDGLAWIEWSNGGEVALRTVGWADETPGTGRPADDNATFALELPTDVWLEGWREARDGDTVLMVAHPDAAWTIHLERQADGAWAMAPDAVAVR